MRARVIRRRHVRTIVTSNIAMYAAGFLSLGGIPSTWVRADALEFIPGMSSGDNMTLEWVRAHAIAHDFVIASALAFVAAAIVPFFVLSWRARATELTLGEGVVRVGISSFRAADVTGFSVAPDGHGVSVAIGTGAQTTFLEVDTIEDARRIATALKQRFPGGGDLKLTLPRQSQVLVVVMYAFVSLTMALLVPLFGRDEHGIFALWCNAPLLSVLLAALVVLRIRQPMFLQWGRTDIKASSRSLDHSPIERHARRHLDARLVTDPAPPRVRVDLFAQGNDSIPAWLARVDGLERAGGYRGESAPRELLFETVGDEHAPVDVRLAAARLLRVRDGEHPMRIVESVTDADVRARIKAVTKEDAAVAAAELDEIGLFRAR